MRNRAAPQRNEWTGRVRQVRINSSADSIVKSGLRAHRSERGRSDMKEGQPRFDRADHCFCRNMTATAQSYKITLCNTEGEGDEQPRG